MILLATNRPLPAGGAGGSGRRGGEPLYLYGEVEGPPGSLRFPREGERGFRATLLRAPRLLRDRHGVETPKVGLYFPGRHADRQAAIGELAELHEALRSVLSHPPVVVGFSWFAGSGARGAGAGGPAHPESDPAAVMAADELLERACVFLGEIERDCFSVSFCIAQGRGAELLRRGLEPVVERAESRGLRRMFDETVLLAPALAPRDLALGERGACISRISRRVHLYHSKYDVALGEHLGRGGVDGRRVLPANVVTVDAARHASPAGVRRAGLAAAWGEPLPVHDCYRRHPAILADLAQVLAREDEGRISTRRPHPRPATESCNHFVLV